MPDDEPLAWGEIRESGSTMCFDTLGKDAGNPVGMYSCHGQGGNQAFTLTRGKELKTEGDLCIDVSGNFAPSTSDVFFLCWLSWFLMGVGALPSRGR